MATNWIYFCLKTPHYYTELLAYFSSESRTHSFEKTGRLHPQSLLYFPSLVSCFSPTTLLHRAFSCFLEMGWVADRKGLLAWPRHGVVRPLSKLGIARALWPHQVILLGEIRTTLDHCSSCYKPLAAAQVQFFPEQLFLLLPRLVANHSLLPFGFFRCEFGTNLGSSSILDFQAQLPSWLSWSSSVCLVSAMHTCTPCPILQGPRGTEHHCTHFLLKLAPNQSRLFVTWIS